MTTVGIVGSGHTAIAVAKKLVRRGVKPTILDSGETLDRERQRIVDRLAATARSEWPAGDVAEITRNPTVTTDKPRRLAYGSTYVYGGDRPALPLEESPAGPRPTYARGGFSEIWGAAILPAADRDLVGWPVRHADLAPYYREVVEGLPVSAAEDGLSRHFPLFGSSSRALDLTPALGSLLGRMNRSRWLTDRDDVCFGQARLAVRVDDDEQGPGCCYCGYCLSGCVYGSISAASQSLEQLEGAGAVDYRPGRYVVRLEERGDNVAVTSELAGGGREVATFGRVFLAAGAINSTRIVLESKGLFNRRVLMRGTQGLIVPLVRLRGAPFPWPDANTLAGLFFEFQAPPVSEHWIHVQISSPNELVLQRLGYRLGGRGVKQRLLEIGLRRLLVAACNFHSEHAGWHALTLRRSGDGGRGTLAIETLAGAGFPQVAKRALRRLAHHMLRVGVLALLPMVKGARGKPWGWHFGGTLPMSENPRGELATDLLGRPTGWSRVHVVDSSTFPSLPSTTVALLAMANACRVADRSPLD